MTKLWEYIGRFVSGLVGFVAAAAVRALVIAQFWAWFILAIFPAAPPLTVPTAYGLGLFVSLMALRARITANPAEPPEPWWGPTVYWLVAGPLYLAFGWLVSRLIWGW